MSYGVCLNKRLISETAFSQYRGYYLVSYYIDVVHISGRTHQFNLRNRYTFNRSHLFKELRFYYNPKRCYELFHDHPYGGRIVKPLIKS